MVVIDEYQIVVDMNGGIHLADTAACCEILIRPAGAVDVVAALNDAIAEGRRKARATELRARIAEMQLELHRLEEFSNV